MACSEGKGKGNLMIISSIDETNDCCESDNDGDELQCSQGNRNVNGSNGFDPVVAASGENSSALPPDVKEKDDQNINGAEDQTKTSKGQWNDDTFKIKTDTAPEDTYQDKYKQNHKRKSKTKIDETRNSDIFKFVTNQGLVVRMYPASIVNLHVDAIVNAANENLHNIGGVAKVIEDAAGDRLKRACRQYIKQNGTLTVASNCVTEPGDLPCRKVIHAVGPNWHMYTSKRKCLEMVAATVKGILTTAEKEKFRTVGMPPISSGLFAVPKSACASMYLKGILDFSQTLKGTHPHELHIVDIRKELLHIIKETYEGLKAVCERIYIDVASEAVRAQRESDACGKETKKQLQRTRLVGHTEPERLQRTINGLNIHVYTGNLVELKNVDCIVSTENPHLTGSGAVAKAILEKAGEKYEREHKNMKNPQGHRHDEILVSQAGKLPFKRIFHVIIGKFQRSQTKAESIYTHVLAVLDKADSIASIRHNGTKSIRSLALPLLGAGHLEDHHYLTNVCAKLCSAVEYFARKTQKSLEEIHLVNINPEITAILQSHLQSSWECRYSARQNRNDSHVQVSAKPFEQSKRTKSTLNRDFNFDHPLIEKWVAEKVLEKHNVREFMTSLAPKVQKGACANFTDKESGKENKGPGNYANGPDDTDQCIICIDEMEDPVELNLCKHQFCKTCIVEYFNRKLACPVCNTVYGKIYGDQPVDGKADIYLDKSSLPGYDRTETFIINYDIPNGTQKDYHPNPGKSYKGLNRQAYVPNNEEGQEVLHMLEKAFKQRLIFTMGSSRTSGKDNVITWNDIHHKTSRTGGPERFGYPDPDYLSRVKSELNAKGIQSDYQ